MLNAASTSKLDNLGVKNSKNELNRLDGEIQRKEEERLNSHMAKKDSISQCTISTNSFHALK